MNFKKSQSSLEFLIIFGMGFIFIILLSSIFFSYSKSASNSLDKEQIDKIGFEITSNIEKIYFLGSGNRVTMKAKFPNGIENFTIKHKNISDPNNLGQYIQFDYLDIEVLNDIPKNLTDTIHNIYESNQLYIRFNCTKCYQTIPINGNWISYYNDSDFNGGAKSIRFEGFENYVSVDFYFEQ